MPTVIYINMAPTVLKHKTIDTIKYNNIAAKIDTMLVGRVIGM